MCGSFSYRLVSARCVFGGREHACLDDPDRVCEEGGQDARSARGEEVVARSEFVIGAI